MDSRDNLLLPIVTALAVVAGGVFVVWLGTGLADGWNSLTGDEQLTVVFAVAVGALLILGGPMIGFRLLRSEPIAPSPLHGDPLVQVFAVAAIAAGLLVGSWFMVGRLDRRRPDTTHRAGTHRQYHLDNLKLGGTVAGATATWAEGTNTCHSTLKNTEIQGHPDLDLQAARCDHGGGSVLAGP